MTNASDDFFGGGAGLNWGPTNDTTWLNRPRGGRVVGEPRQEQQTDINTRQPLFWDAQRTRPMMQLVIPVCCDGTGYAAQMGWNTDERVDAQDNGHRNWYIKGKDLTEALGAAIKTNGVPGIRMGDEVYGVWTGMRPGKTAGTTARTWWAAHIVGVAPAVNQQAFFGNQPQDQGLGQHVGQQTFVPPSQIDTPRGPAPHPGPPPQFGQPTQQPAHPAPPAAAPAWGGAPATPAQAPVPPAANPWGQAPQQPTAAQAATVNPWGA